MSYMGRIARGLLAMAALVAMVALPPVVLWAVADWPLPTAVPTLAQLRRGLGAGGLSDVVIIKAIAVVGWALWLQVLAGLALEVPAALRHRQARRSRLIGPAQLLVRRLVATATFVIGTGLPAAAGGGLLRPPVAPAAVAATWSPPPVVSSRELVASPPPRTEDLPVYVVRAGDSLRSIAKDHLGTEERWEEIFQLNRHVPQDHGRLEVSSLIRPGWVLRLPADAAGLPAGGRTEAPAKRYVVGPDDNLAKIAARHLGGEPRRGWEIWRLNKGKVMADGQRFVDANLIHPGWVLDLPADAVGLLDANASGMRASGGEDTGGPEVMPSSPHPAATAPPNPQPAATETAAVPSRPPASPVPEGAVPAPASSSSTVPQGEEGSQPSASPHEPVLPVPVPAAVVAASGVLAACVVAALDRLRRRQHRSRRPGRDVVRPAAALEPAEAKWRAIAPDDAAEWIDGTLRLLGVGLADGDGKVAPDVLLVRAGELGVELVLSSAATDPPAGFTVADDGVTWRLDDSITRTELRRRTKAKVPLAPALVTLGATPEGQILVDLERIGTLCVEGDPSRVAAFCTGAAMQLATGPWTETTQVRLLGGPEELARAFPDDVEIVADVEKLAAELEELSRENHQRHVSSTLSARAAAGGTEGYPPLVVVAWSDAAPPEVLSRLILAAGTGGRSGVGLVAAGPAQKSAWRVAIDHSGQALVEPLGIVLDAVGADPGLVEAAPALLAAAAETDDVAKVSEPDLVPPRPKGTKEIRILRPEPEVDSWERRPNRRIVTELAVYLATRDGGRPRSSDEIRAALWPLGADLQGKEVSEETFRTYVSHLRSCLGRHHVPDAGDVGGYCLDDVRTDWARFKALLGEARFAAATEAAALLSEALSLVQGRPFTHVAKGTYTFAYSELLVSEIEVAVSDAAHRLASLALDAGDPVTAAEAASKGLMVVPTMERLYQDRMMAAAMSRDRDALHQVRRDAERSLSALGPDEELSEEMLALYHQLLDTLRQPGPAVPGSSGNGTAPFASESNGSAKWRQVKRAGLAP